MKCQDKSTIKLSSNIIKKSTADMAIGMYIPFEYKSSLFRDVRMYNQLSAAQQQQHLKQFFYAENIEDDGVRYPEKTENEEKCAGCKFREICY